MYPDNDPGDQPYNRYGTFNEYQRNKKSLTLDLSRDDCREVARGLIPIADVVMENYSARVMRNFGLDYPTVRPLNPAIIFVSMPGFGTTGPHRNHVSYGTNIEPTAGYANMMGYPGPVPYKSGEAYPDPNAGVNAVAAVLTALYYRRRSGKGQFIDLSQNEATGLPDRGSVARLSANRGTSSQDGESPRLPCSAQRLQVQGRRQLGSHSGDQR